MKREELMFKCVVTPKMEEVIANKAKEKGFKFDRGTSSTGFIIIQDKILYSVSMSEFINNNNSYREFEELCKLIDSVEESQPPFEFKPFHKILVRDHIQKIWRPKQFARIFENHFEDIEDANCSMWNMMIPYEGNEEFCHTSNEPNAWWVVEDKKPKLMRKEMFNK